MGWVDRGNLKGPTGTIDQASAVLLPAGAAPTVGLGGSPAHRTMQFGIPKGDQGAQGIPGFDAVPTDAGVAQLVALPSATRTAFDKRVAEKTFVLDTDHADLEAALAATASGGTLEIRKAHSRGTTFTVNKTVTLRFAQFGEIITTAAPIAAVTVTADNVRIESPRLSGTGGTVSGLGVGIAALGIASAPILGLQIITPAISEFTKYGIYLTHCREFLIEGGFIQRIAYAAIMVLSGKNGVVRGVHTKDILMPSGFTNAYGIALSRDSIASLTDAPRSSDITVDGCLVEGVPGWEGIDTHAGERITIVNNTVLGCKTGIAIVGSSSLYAPQSVLVANNTVDSQVTTGSAGCGVLFVGAPGAIGSPIELATGAITGNTIRNHGGDTAGLAGILAYVTRGLVVTGNTLIEPVSNGVTLYYDNYGFVLTGNTVVDAWAQVITQAAAYRLRSTHNVGVVAHNTTVRGGKVAAHVNEFGFYVQDTSTTTVNVQLGPNDWSGVATPIIDTAGRSSYSLDAPVVKVGRSGQKVGFYAATPIARPVITGSRAGESAASASTRAALVALGLATDTTTA